MSLPNQGRGRPKGAKTKAPVVSITEARRALEAVKARAAEGNEVDQRLLVEAFIAQRTFLNPLGFPVGGGGSLSTALDNGGDDGQAARG